MSELSESTWLWRELPVLEATIRLARHGVDITPERVADEALLHVDDARLGVDELVRRGFLDRLAVASADGRHVEHVTVNFVIGPMRSAQPAATRRSTSPPDAAR
jgi:hypothetical protein